MIKKGCNSMYISNIEVEKLSDTQLTKLLFSDIEDDKKQGDCIFVVGSSKATQYRLPKAVELYKKGRASKILFSGGVTWNNNDAPEAINLKNQAMILGIPEKDIDRKSTRLNSSHVSISYAVFCLKKKKRLRMSRVGTGAG